MNPLELTDYLVAAVMALSGFIIGRNLERHKRPEPLRPICTCGHGYGTHTDGKSCQDRIEQGRYNAHGSYTGREWVPCPCQRYDGPDPVMLGMIP